MAIFVAINHPSSELHMDTRKATQKMLKELIGIDLGINDIAKEIESNYATVKNILEGKTSRISGKLYRKVKEFHARKLGIAAAMPHGVLQQLAQNNAEAMNAPAMSRLAGIRIPKNAEDFLAMIHEAKSWSEFTPAAQKKIAAQFEDVSISIELLLNEMVSRFESLKLESKRRVNEVKME